MKKAMIISLAVFLGALSSPPLQAQKKGHAEFSIGGVGLSDGTGGADILGGAFSLGYHRADGIGMEIGGLVLPGAAVFSGNLVLSALRHEEFIPYVTGGLWTTTFGGFGWNLGIGFKFKIKGAFAVRAEYRFWSIFENSGNEPGLIILGFSWFF